MMAQQTLAEYYKTHKSHVTVFQSDRDMEILRKISKAPGVWLDIAGGPGEALAHADFLYHNSELKKYRLTEKGVRFLHALGLLNEIFAAVIALKRKTANRHEWRILWKYYCPIIDAIAAKNHWQKFDRDDITQETFLRVFKSGQTLKDVTNFESWFRTIAYNEWKRHQRRHKKTRNVSYDNLHQDNQGQKPAEKQFGNSNNPEDEIEYNELVDRIKDCIHKMPQRRQEAFMFCINQDLSHKQAAEIMQISVRAVEQHLYRARDFLRECLEKDKPGTKETE